MTSAVALSSASPVDNLMLALEQAPAQAERLAQLLQEEFEALKKRNLTAFEALQESKNQVLEDLSRLAQACSAMQPAPAAWQALQDGLRLSREHHLRNTQLLQRQLEAVRGALQALQGEAAPAVDLYDRSGHVSRRYAAWSHHLA